MNRALHGHWLDVTLCEQYVVSLQRDFAALKLAINYFIITSILNRVRVCFWPLWSLLYLSYIIISLSKLLRSLKHLVKRFPVLIGRGLFDMSWCPRFFAHQTLITGRWKPINGRSVKCQNTFFNLAKSRDSTQSVTSMCIRHSWAFTRCMGWPIIRFHLSTVRWSSRLNAGLGRK